MRSTRTSGESIKEERHHRKSDEEKRREKMKKKKYSQEKNEEIKMKIRIGNFVTEKNANE